MREAVSNVLVDPQLRLDAEGADGWFSSDTLDELADYIGYTSEQKDAFLAIVTTNDQRVLNEDHQPIEGLHATGNNLGMRFGAAPYMQVT